MFDTVKQQNLGTVGMLADRSRYAIEIVTEALQVVEAFAWPPHRFTCTELSERTGLSKNKTFRLLQTLVVSGMVQLEPESKHYRLGLAVLRLVSAVYAGDDLLLAARDTLNWVQATVDERVNLGTFDGTRQALCIDTRDSSRWLQISARVGARFPLHSGAISKVLLAFSAPEVIEHYLRHYAAGSSGTPPLRTAGELRQELASIRKQGISLSESDLDEGVCAIAAPIFNRQGEISAGVSVAVPVARFTESYREQLQALILEAGERISRTLGFIFPPTSQYFSHGRYASAVRLTPSGVRLLGLER